ncbi:putative POM121-like protein 1 [Plecturocebus cupreus]
MLPPPLKLGFRVTAEDLDPEKEAVLRSIYSALRGEAKAIWDCRASRPSQALSLPAIETSPPAVPKAPSMDAQQETHKSQDSLGCLSLLASAAGAPSLPAVSGRKRRSAGPLSKCGPQPEKPKARRFCGCSYGGALTPLQGTPRRGPHRMERKEAPHIPELSPSCSRSLDLDLVPVLQPAHLLTWHSRQQVTLRSPP